MTFIDFADLKAQLPIADAIPKLGLALKQRGESWRGPCPTCRTGGDRALVVTPAKQAFYCFAAKAGGDVIALAAHIHDCSMKDAAAYLAGEGDATCETGNRSIAQSPSTVPEERSKEAARSLQPLTYLQAEHQSVQGVGLEHKMCEAFGAGYAPKGIMRGRLAIPIHDWNGTLLAYCGRAVKGESPTLTFPNGFTPSAHIFNAHRVAGSELILVRDPLDALLAIQNGIDDVIAFLTETKSAEQLQTLAALMDEKGCETVELF